MAGLTLINSPLLTREILAEMPQGLSSIEQIRWQKRKENELKAKAALSNQDGSQTAASDGNKAEKSEANDKPVSETPADSNLSDDEVSAKTEKRHPISLHLLKKQKPDLLKVRHQIKQHHQNTNMFEVCMRAFLQLYIGCFLADRVMVI